MIRVICSASPARLWQPGKSEENVGAPKAPQGTSKQSDARLPHPTAHLSAASDNSLSEARHHACFGRSLRHPSQKVRQVVVEPRCRFASNLRRSPTGSTIGEFPPPSLYAPTL